MGQQQLLLLVLSTVIVGLATVAGIQAFSENQAQASQDALVQRGTALASQIKALQAKPSQLGGIDLTASNSNNKPGANEIAKKLGLSANPFAVEGGGAGAFCEITVSADHADLQCQSDNAAQDVRVRYDAGNDEVTTDFNQDYNDITAESSF